MFVKSTTIDVIVNGKLSTWVIVEHDIRNIMENYDAESELGRIKINISNWCTLANGENVHFLSNEE